MSKNFRVLVYEDNEAWTKAFKFNLEKRLKKNGVDLKLMSKINDSTLLSDLEFLPNLIMVDYDLGELTGEDIIKRIEGDPDYKTASICLYSGGESIDSLKQISRGLKGNIHCHIKDGKDLVEFVLSMASRI